MIEYVSIMAEIKALSFFAPELFNQVINWGTKIINVFLIYLSTGH